MPSMKEITCACGCGRKRMVRTADIARGWGKYYSKSCKAKAQERRTNQYFNYLNSGVSREVYLEYQRQYGGNPQFDHKGEYVGFTAGFSNED